MTIPSVKNGAKHPDSNKRGNTTFPKTAPTRPIIISRDTAIVLKKNFITYMIHKKNTKMMILIKIKKILEISINIRSIISIIFRFN